MSDTETDNLTDANKKKMEITDKKEPITKNSFELIMIFGIFFIVILGTANLVKGSSILVSSFIYMVLVLILIVLISSSLFRSSADLTSESVRQVLEYLFSFIEDKFASVYLVSFLLILYTSIFITGVPMGPDKPLIIAIGELIIYVILFLSVIEVISVKTLQISFVKILRDWLIPLLFNSSGLVTNDKKTETALNESVQMPEVFHIAGNRYTYNDAKEVCKAHNAKLATYDQIESAYQNGAEWCEYGWSDGQHVYYPTQKETWNKLQEMEGYEHICGRPGVNGGYMDNTRLTFGANCYGIKPAKTDTNSSTYSLANIMDIYKTIQEKQAEESLEEIHKDKPAYISGFNFMKWFENWV